MNVSEKILPNHPNYSISDDGLLTNHNYRSTGKSKSTRGSVTRYGYLVFTSPFVIKAHRLVALLFIPNPENKKCVNHINGIKSDNRLENLEWCTHSENTLHAYRLNLMSDRNGINNPASKLTEDDVRAIRFLEGVYNQTELGKIFGIAQTKISYVLSKKTYKNVI